MGAFLSKLLGAIVGPVINAVYAIFKQKKLEDKAKTAESMEKAVETVNETLKVEEKVRDEQAKVEAEKNSGKETVEAKDGGLDFGGFNEKK